MNVLFLLLGDLFLNSKSFVLFMFDLLLFNELNLLFFPNYIFLMLSLSLLLSLGVPCLLLADNISNLPLVLFPGEYVRNLLLRHFILQLFVNVRY